MRIHSFLSTAGALSAAIVFAVGAAARDAQAQNLAARVRQAGDGTVRFSFAAREGVCGNGRNNISVRSDRNQDIESECEAGPVMVALTKAQGAVTSLRTYVGAKWRVGGADVTQLGTVGARRRGGLSARCGRRRQWQGGRAGHLPGDAGRQRDAMAEAAAFGA